MNDAHTVPRAERPRKPPGRRRAEALVAQYIHELSDRHARSRNGSRPDAGRSRRRAATSPLPETQEA
jgi:hypothetical protein